MAQIFVSYAKEDTEVARQIVNGLEEAGYSTWYYERDTVPGDLYLSQIDEAIDRCAALVLVISPHFRESTQVVPEVVHAFETRKPLFPVLYDVAHDELPRFQPEIREPLRTATSISISADGVPAIIPRIVAGLARVGLLPMAATITSGSNRPTAVTTTDGDWVRAGEVELRLQPFFEHNAYWADEDPIARFLLELEFRQRGQVAKADIFLVLDVSASMDTEDRYPLLREAVKRLVHELEPSHRIGIVVFGRDADIVLTPTLGATALGELSEILGRLDSSPIKFSGATRLAPGLRSCLSSLTESESPAYLSRRVYVLTDGDIHDPEACVDLLSEFRRRKIEVHAYGFGLEFDPVALKRLLSDQLGGSVKPICDEQDIVDTFGHVAAVNRRIVASEGTLTLRFDNTIVCGDAWAFRPHERYLGPIKGRRLVRELGALESQRVYSLLVEVRLPEVRSERSSIAKVRLAWRTAAGEAEHLLRVEAQRISRQQHSETVLIPRVAQAYAILNALRHGSDQQVLLASAQARLELARVERRDPDYVAALAKKVAILKGESPNSFVADEIRAYLELESDRLTKTGLPPVAELKKLGELLERAMKTDCDPRLVRELHQRVVGFLNNRACALCSHRQLPGTTPTELLRWMDEQRERMRQADDLADLVTEVEQWMDMVLEHLIQSAGHGPNEVVELLTNLKHEVCRNGTESKVAALIDQRIKSLKKRRSWLPWNRNT